MKRRQGADRVLAAITAACLAYGSAAAGDAVYISNGATFKVPDTRHTMAAEWASAGVGSPSARYLAPDLPGPERGSPDKAYELDMAPNLRPIPVMAPPHPLARDSTARLCRQPPQPAWQRWLNEGMAYADHARAEPLDGRQAYLPFDCGG